MASHIISNETILSQIHRVKNGIISVKSLGRNLVLPQSTEKMKWVVSLQNLVCTSKMHFHESDLITVISPHLVLESNADRHGSVIYKVLASGVPDHSLGSHKIQITQPIDLELCMFNTNELLFYVAKPSSQQDGVFHTLTEFSGLAHMIFTLQ